MAIESCSRGRRSINQSSSPGLRHRPSTQVLFPRQRSLQRPQLLSSNRVSTHSPAHRVRPDEHTHSWVPTLHSSVVAHCVSATHPERQAPVSSLQYVNPMHPIPLVRQSFGLMQLPCWQVSVPSHAFAQPPQKRGSSSRSTHWTPQRVNPSLHTQEWVERSHRSLASGHCSWRSHPGRH